MLAPFDWLRLARTGAELLATLRLLEAHCELPAAGGELAAQGAAPFSALYVPCARCWAYPRQHPRKQFCATCQEILDKAHQAYMFSRYTTLVWGFVTQLPRQLQSGGFPKELVAGQYIHDAHHFLVVVPQQQLQPWLQEVVLYNGTAIKGLLQVFPTTGGKFTRMNDLLIRIVHHDARFPPDRLRVRFLAAAHDIYHLHELDREGVLTFDIGDFLSTLEMAAVFRTLLLPDEQKLLYELLKLEGDAESRFYWGRLVSQLGIEARDMLNAWQIRHWSPAQVDLLYRLIEYVRYY